MPVQGPVAPSPPESGPFRWMPPVPPEPLPLDPPAPFVPWLPFEPPEPPSKPEPAAPPQATMRTPANTKALRRIMEGTLSGSSQSSALGRPLSSLDDRRRRGRGVLVGDGGRKIEEEEGEGGLVGLEDGGAAEARVARADVLPEVVDVGVDVHAAAALHAGRDPDGGVDGEDS